MEMVSKSSPPTADNVPRSQFSGSGVSVLLEEREVSNTLGLLLPVYVQSCNETRPVPSARDVRTYTGLPLTATPRPVKC